MRLYLSSYGLGNYTDHLLDMARDNNHVAVIANACDALDDDLRKERVEREFVALRSLGLEPHEIDLRNYFDGSFSQNNLDNFGVVWVRGGNVFNLRRAMKMSNFDAVITDMLQRDAIAYGGYSAGSCVLAPTLQGIELCDPVDKIPNGYPQEIIWDGLDLISYEIAPHYKSNHPESPLIDDVVHYLQSNNIAHETLRDGEVIVVDGEKTEKFT